MFQKVFEYAGPHKKGLYAATAIVLVSVLLGVFPFVLAYQVIAPLVMGEAITASFIIQHVRHWHREKAVRGRCRQSGSSAGTLYAGGHRQPDGSHCSLCGNVLCRLEAGTVIFGIHSA